MRFLKKLISLCLSAFAVLIISGFISLKPIANTPALAAQPPACEDATGTTTPVIANIGNADSGTLDFDTAYHINYQACTLQSKKMRTLGVLANGTSTLTTIRGYFLEGYAQNTNLGSVSFSCESGKNRGVDCGSVEYGVVASGVVVPSTDPPQTDNLRGFAWGPNIGWISMGCHGGKNLAEGDCGNVDYGVKVVIDAEKSVPTCSATPLKEGDLYGYAWTNTVGWLNFCGAHITVPAPIIPVIDPQSVLVEPNPNYPPPGGGGGEETPPPVTPPALGNLEDVSFEKIYKGPSVYANGEDSYKIVIKLKRRDKVLTLTDLPADFSVTADFTGTTLRADQITTNQCNNKSCVDGAIWAVNSTTSSLFKNIGGDITSVPLQWDSAAGGFAGEIKAIAPTNKKDVIKLKYLTLIDGQGADREETEYPLDRSNQGWDLPFLPAVEVSRLISVNPRTKTEITDASGVIGSDVIPQEISLSAEKHNGYALNNLANSAISVFTQIHRCTNNTNYQFNLGLPDAALLNTSPPTLISLSNEEINKMATNAHQITDDRPCSDDSGGNQGEGQEKKIEGNQAAKITLDQILDTDKNIGTISRTIQATKEENGTSTKATSDDLDNIKNAIGLRTRVQYEASVESQTNTTTVHYFAKAMPDRSIMEQIARIQGNVRIDVQKNLREDVVTKTVGAYAASKRDPYYRALIDKAATAETTIPDSIPAAASGLKYYKNNPSTSGFGTSYKPCKIFIGNKNIPDEIVKFAENLTIASIGCDIYINSNIYKSTGRLGIIALADTRPQQGQTQPPPAATRPRGGNIYICNRVTDIEANMVAEGSLFSYGKSETDCGDSNATGPDAVVDANSGLPVINTYFDDNRKNQLVIVGSIISNNTYGGALQTPALLGDGATTTSIENARLYDINFLRYPFAQTQTIASENQLCWANGVQLSKYFIDKDEASCENGNAPEFRGIVNIIYRAPEAGMQVFNEVK